MFQNSLSMLHIEPTWEQTCYAFDLMNHWRCESIQYFSEWRSSVQTANFLMLFWYCSDEWNSEGCQFFLSFKATFNFESLSFSYFPSNSFCHDSSHEMHLFVSTTFLWNESFLECHCYPFVAIFDRARLQSEYKTFRNKDRNRELNLISEAIKFKWFVHHTAVDKSFKSPSSFIRIYRGVKFYCWVDM